MASWDRGRHDRCARERRKPYDTSRVGSDRVDTWMTEGRRAFPEVTLDEAAFRVAVGDGCTEGRDLYLAVACARGDAAAVRQFERDYLDRVASWLKLPATERAIVDEVRQRVAARILVGRDGEPPRIAQYTGRGPLWGWVRVITLREHARLRREDGRETTGLEAAERLARTAELSPDLLALREHREAMMEAFRAALTALPAADRTLLRLAYVDALSLDAIGRMYAVNKSTISRRLATCRAEILAAATTCLRERLAMPARDIESLLAVMPRDLDVSLLGLLQTSA